MFTLVAWTEVIDTGANYGAVQALDDQHVTIRNDQVIVPEFAPNLCGNYAIGLNLTHNQVSSPRLRAESLVDNPYVQTAIAPPDDPAWLDIWETPRPLDPGEGLIQNVIENGVGATRVSVFAWLCDEITPAPEGVVEIIEFYSLTTLVPYTWTLCPLVPTQQLRAGRYAIVGMRAESANGIVARLVMTGESRRPGCIVNTQRQNTNDEKFTRARPQKWGEFTHTYTPQAEFFADQADTSEIVFLYVVRIGEAE